VQDQDHRPGALVTGADLDAVGGRREQRCHRRR
jgi:hypothetical protein